MPWHDELFARPLHCGRDGHGNGDDRARAELARSPESACEDPEAFDANDLDAVEGPVMATTARQGFVGTIGNTPLIRLRRASDATGCEILGKAEFLNPGGSIKDRAALAIVLDAERRGLLRHGGTPGLLRRPEPGRPADLERFGFRHLRPANGAFILGQAWLQRSHERCRF